MPLLDEALTEQFYRWEIRGRGWQSHAYPVLPEPPFRPFFGYQVPSLQALDDGRKHTFVSRIISRIKSPRSHETLVNEDDEPLPELGDRDAIEEIAISLPAEVECSRDAFENLLLNLSMCAEPVAFEFLGTATQLKVQLAVGLHDAGFVLSQAASFFPDVMFSPVENSLERSFASDDAAFGVAEFGLAQEFMLPIKTGKYDLFVGLSGALARLRADEFGLYQVIFQPVRSSWGESIVRAVSNGYGENLFVNRPDLLAKAHEKISHPLFGAVIRLIAGASRFERSNEIIVQMAAALRGLTQPQGNSFIPIASEVDTSATTVDDIVYRRSKRSGILLNSKELLALAHLPGKAVTSPKLRQRIQRSEEAPAIVRIDEGILLGENEHLNDVTPVRLSYEHRSRHTHVIGASGTGKSSLLFNLITQDIENGEGVAVLDPHGDLIDDILGAIPPHRIDDVVLIDPADERFTIGFNILSTHSELEKNLLASDLVSVFRRLSTSWGDQMDSVLQNSILAFLESDTGGTLSDLRHFLIDTDYRKTFLKTVKDPEIQYYWQHVFPQLSGNKSIGSIVTRLDTFLRPKPIRHMLAQTGNRLDFTHIMDSGKILLAKLPEGIIGQENSYLLGTLLVSKLQQIAMSRQSLDASERKPFWLYVDEFHNFITPSMTKILAGARKYRLALILAHQELRPLYRDPELLSAVLTSTCTRVCFRLGDEDARSLQDSFSHFEALDFQNLGTGEAICRIERSSFDFNFRVPMPLTRENAKDTRQRVIDRSREQYGTSIAVSGVPVPPRASPSEVPEKEANTEPVEAVAPVSEEPRREVQRVSEGKPAQTTARSTLGRGGPQHQFIQERLRQVANGLGWFATIEKVILDGKGSVDLALEKNGMHIACEISVTTPISHEVDNVIKCIRAQVPLIAVIATDDDRLRKIGSAVNQCVGEENKARVSYFSPDDFVKHLTSLSLSASPTVDKPTLRHGYKVKTTGVMLCPDEQAQKEQDVAQVMADVIRKKRKK